MNLKGGLLIGIAVGCGLFALIMTINMLLVYEWLMPFEEEEKQRKIIEYGKQLQEKKLEQQLCEDQGGIWESCPPCIAPPGAEIHCEPCMEFCKDKEGNVMFPPT